MTLGVTVQYFDGCPGLVLATERVREAASRAGLDVSLRLERVETSQDAQRLGFVGSPTVLVEGRDVSEPGAATPALTCRLYAGDGGAEKAPSVTTVMRALTEADSARNG